MPSLKPGQFLQSLRTHCGNSDTRTAPSNGIRRLDLDDAVVRYRLRRHRRSRGIALRLGLTPEVQVTAPPGTPVRLVERALRAHADWIRREGGVFPADDPAPGTPLPFQGETLNLRLVSGHTPRIRRNGATLVASGEPRAPEALRERLIRWYQRQARTILPSRTGTLAAHTGLTPSRIAIRDQRSRWGSCSGRGSVNLNWRLVMLDPALMDHVIIHELCHLAHMNHSPAFWGEVARHDPDYRTHHQALHAFRAPL